MRLAVTGGTGLVGRFIVEAALQAGHRVTVHSRRPPPAGFFSAAVEHWPYDLTGPVPSLAQVDALVHAAFLHVPGRYRGGEGDDPAGFMVANRDGSLRLFEAARQAGVARTIFLSSRAVYGVYPPGTRLSEDMSPRPDTLYGKVKFETEEALAGLAAPGYGTASLRATGVYGPAAPGQNHKWHDLFVRFLSGEPVAPRVATEVHGADLAAAVLLLLEQPVARLDGRCFNVSDLLLDRRDLLAGVAALTGYAGPLPERAEAAKVSVMSCTRLQSLGWRPGGLARLESALPGMLP